MFNIMKLPLSASGFRIWCVGVQAGAGQLSAGDRKVFSLVILTIQIGLSCGTLDHRRRQIQGQSVLFVQGHHLQFTLLSSSYPQNDVQGGASYLHKTIFINQISS